MADRFWVGGTGNWDAAGTSHWSTSSGGSSGASVPTSSDNVFFDANSNATAYTVTITATANCLNLTFANPASGVVTWAGSSAMRVFGNLVLASGMTRTWNGIMNMDALSGTKTITSNGVTFGSEIQIGDFGSTATISLVDSLTTSATVKHLGGGHFDLNDNNVTCGYFEDSTTNGILSLGSGILTLTASAGFANAATNLTVTSTTGTIRLSDTSGIAKTFAGGGKTYNILDVATGGAGAIIITGANTFTRITATGGTTKTFTLPGSTTTTLTGTTPLPSGASGNLLTFNASSGSATVSCANAVDCDYLSLTNVVASGAAIPFYAGTHSTDGGGNTNWLFTDPPPGPEDEAMGAIFAPLLLLS